MAAHRRRSAQPPVRPGQLLRPADPPPLPFAWEASAVPAPSLLSGPPRPQGRPPTSQSPGSRAQHHTNFLPCHLSPVSALSGTLHLSPTSSTPDRSLRGQVDCCQTFRVLRGVAVCCPRRGLARKHLAVSHATDCCPLTRAGQGARGGEVSSSLGLYTHLLPQNSV